MLTVFYYSVLLISWFFSVVTFLLCYSTEIHYTTNAWTFAVLLAAAFLLALARRSRLPFLVAALLLPAAALLWETTLYGRMELLLPWALLAVFAARSGGPPERREFLRLFSGLLWGYLFPGVFLFFGSDHAVEALEGMVPYVVVFLAAGVLLMQLLRYPKESEDKKRLERHQAIQTALFFLGCLAVTAGRFLQYASAFLSRFVLRPLWQLISGVWKSILELFGSTEPEAPNRASFFGDFDKYLKDVEEQRQGREPMVDANHWPQAETQAKEWSLVPLFLFLVLLVLVVLLVLLLRSRKRSIGAAAVKEERETFVPERQPQKRRGWFLTPQETVREQYRLFMKRADTRERPLLASDTTAEIREKFEQQRPTSGERSAELTELYRGVRYGGREVRKEDAARAKRLLRELSGR